jgi:hypothetical protein
MSRVLLVVQSRVGVAHSPSVGTATTEGKRELTSLVY